ncbi:Endonuclease/exonuclease/phosphatase [Aspergillus avenaceus]|uniref:Endonuclease/exonuclease/phosphatase n=1 Tax=Aspergillus avenaceus TaxID=36643 RepID=A0A5N6U2S0_ASPAV|nr:Endonuclease/exonuclease/phosphatase [Aspergillus avenaceus]
MNFYARVRTSLLSWMHETPLPTTDSHTSLKFQSWHHFHQDLQQWVPATNNDLQQATPALNTSPNLTLLTWNIDATSPRTEDRVTEIITFITQLDPQVHVIFFQEVSKTALHQILKDNRIQESWVSSERDDTAWGKQSFATMTLLSKSHFALGPIWRVTYPSHFGRDALCCDVFVPSCGRHTRVRLVNVHLDSLPMRPSHRPRQISIVSSFLRIAGRGLVAGDFNPVLDEDATLPESNSLTDVWVALRPEDPGFTWGTDGEQPFPPNRMDKVAIVGLEPFGIRTLEPKRLGINSPWSDHHALLCSFGIHKE